MIFQPPSLSLRDQCLLKISMSMWASETALRAIAKEIPETNFRPKFPLHPRNVRRKLLELIRKKPFDPDKYVNDLDYEWSYNWSRVLHEPLKDWPKVNRIVEEAVGQLPIPNHLGRKIVKYIEPIGSRVKKWFRTWVKLKDKDGKRLCRFSQATFYAINSEQIRRYFVAIKWVRGDIDAFATAMMVLDDPTIDIAARHRVATLYCLDERIKQIRKQIGKHLSYNSHEGYYVAEAYFPFYTDLGSKVRKAPTLMPFRLSVQLGKVAGAKYFWNKMTPEEQQAVVTGMLNNEAGTYRAYIYPEILDFILNLLNEEQRCQYFKYDFATEDRLARPFADILQYPYQHYFTRCASYVWDYMPANRYYKLVETLLNMVTIKGEVSVYADELANFWNKSPLRFKLIYLMAKSYTIMLRKFSETDFEYLFQLDSKLLKIEHLLEYDDLFATLTNGETIIEGVPVTGEDLVQNVIRYCVDIHTVGYLMYHVEDCITYLSNTISSAILSRLNWLIYGKRVLNDYIKTKTNKTFDAIYERDLTVWAHKNCTICDDVVGEYN